jgi:hypothetical protein
MHSLKGLGEESKSRNPNENGINPDCNSLTNSQTLARSHNPEPMSSPDRQLASISKWIYQGLALGKWKQTLGAYQGLAATHQLPPARAMGSRLLHLNSRCAMGKH